MALSRAGFCLLASIAWLSASPALAVTVCSAGVDPGTGGTGIGTGGTGIERDVGTGGTGIGTGGTGKIAGEPRDPGTGGTGIVGVITGFASICVNGIEAEFDGRTAIFDNGKPAGPGSLKLGQVVHVQAAGRGERVFASRIDIDDVMLGPVTRVDPAQRRLEVMHQPVRWASLGETPGSAAPGSLRPGQYVRVSGFRAAGGEVLATRIEPAPAGRVHLIGTVTATGTRDIEVQGLRVARDAVERSDVRDALVRVEGQWQGDGIGGASVARVGSPFGRDVGFVSMQGVVDAARDEVRVGEVRVSLPGAGAVEGGDGRAPRDGELVQVEATLRGDGTLVVHAVLREDRLARPARGRDAKDAERTQDDARGDDHSDAKAENGRAADDRERDENRGEFGGDDARDERERGRDSRDEIPQVERHDGRDVRDTSRSETRASDQRHGNDSDRLDRTERKTDRSDRVERIERVEKFDRVERVERIERESRAVRIEKVERVERVERVEHSGRDH